MIELSAGTYPYRNRHAIMDAVQAGLLPHTRCEGDDVHLGCVTVLVKVTPPDVVPAWDFSDAVRERAEHWERLDKIVPPDKETGWLPPAMVASLESRGIDPYAAPSAVGLPSAEDVMPEGKA